MLCPGNVSHPNAKISGYVRGKQAFDPFSTRTSEGRLSARFMGVQMINNPI
ncbi:hypothetical protein NBRC3293_2410 [Gluconobacter oxydans NBRC 3293]|uniref:Uncharacterized protein n=1 Tax=Gluconobacter oxydans NBRC 3293 TaxID=1315969 RepID=A0A829WXQ3_GLUOY|nr:hypothetical protein NBRC3293_2410 [Gluconobacter oxydans NBRC 3293]